MKCAFIQIILISLCVTIDGFKVLGIVPIGCKSHFAIGNSILKTLHGAGHDITIISPYPSKKNISNYREIGIEHVLKRKIGKHSF